MLAAPQDTAMSAANSALGAAMRAIEAKRGISDNLLTFARTLTLENGTLLDFASHPYLVDIYNDESPMLVFEKGSQMGLSTYALLSALHACLRGRNVIYYWPTDGGASDASRGKLDPIISRNQSLSRRIGSGADSVHLKKIGDGFLYFRGLTSSVQALSVAADKLYFDEIDYVSPTSHQIAQERLSHSAYKHEVQLSTPSLPDYGIDRDYQRSDQHHWLIKCEACNRDNNLVDRFPDCIVGDEYQCICGGTLDRLAGRWIAKYPDRAIRGYHIPQLIGRHVSPAAIMYKYTTAVSRSEFMRKTVGVPFVDTDDKLSSSDVLACCGSHGMENTNALCVMGVDVGRYFHYVVLTLAGRVVRFGQETDVAALKSIAARYNLYRVVIDANPETRVAADFVKTFKGAGFLCYYARMAGATWDESRHVVRVDRTTHCDGVAQAVRDKSVSFPRADLCGDFAAMLCGTARTVVEDKTTGDKRNVWFKVGDDHYFHALLYALLARGETMPYFSDLLTTG